MKVKASPLPRGLVGKSGSFGKPSSLVETVESNRLIDLE
jgi:hypothetical protein